MIVRNLPGNKEEEIKTEFLEFFLRLSSTANTVFFTDLCDPMSYETKKMIDYFFLYPHIPETVFLVRIALIFAT